MGIQAIAGGEWEMKWIVSGQLLLPSEFCAILRRLHFPSFLVWKWTKMCGHVVAIVKANVYSFFALCHAVIIYRFI